MPQHAELQFRRQMYTGMLLQTENKLPEAYAAYSAALAVQVASDLNRVRGSVFARRSDLLRKLGRRAESNADFEKYMESSLPTALECNKAAWELAVGPEERLDPERALLLAQRAVALEATNAWHLNTLGVAYYRAGQHAKAVETLLEALLEASRLNASTSDPYSPDSDFFFVATAYHQLGDTAKAQEYYQKAVAEWDKRMAKPGALDDEEMKSFRDEAEKLLNIKGRK